MSPSLLLPKHVIVQGITGSHGAFHTAAMRAAGVPIVAGTSPNKAGQFIDGVPVYSSIASIKKDMSIDATVVFVPAPFAKHALLEAINESIPLIVCITEGIPIHDMLMIKDAASKAGVTIIGPNCPGILIPGQIKLGIIPANMGFPGSVGIVSRSGTLTYEAAAELTHRGIGQKYIIGIGGDRIRGIGFIECLELFENDPDVTSIILIGEIGGTDEQRAANYIKESVTKPVFAYIAGHAAPVNVQLGHAGAIFSGKQESAQAKTIALKEVGVATFTNIISLVQAL